MENKEIILNHREDIGVIAVNATLTKNTECDGYNLAFVDVQLASNFPQGTAMLESIQGYVKELYG